MFSRGLSPMPGQTSVPYSSREKVSKDAFPRGSILERSFTCSLAHRVFRQEHISAPTQPRPPHLRQIGVSSMASSGYPAESSSVRRSSCNPRLRSRRAESRGAGSSPLFKADSAACDAVCRSSRSISFSRGKRRVSSSRCRACRISCSLRCRPSSSAAARTTQISYAIRAHLFLFLPQLPPQLFHAGSGPLVLLRPRRLSPRHAGLPGAAAWG